MNIGRLGHSHARSRDRSRSRTPVDDSDDESRASTTAPAKKLTDQEAVDMFYQLQGDNWHTIRDNAGDQILFYEKETGTWVPHKAVGKKLLKQCKDELGQYATHDHKMEIILKDNNLGQFNVKSQSWYMENFNQLEPYVVPFKDGIFDIRQRGDLQPHKRENYLTSTFDFEAPKDFLAVPPGYEQPSFDNVSAETDEINSLLDNMMPEKALKDKVMTWIAAAFFVGKPGKFRKIVQILGGGKNGKTLFFVQILATAFPAWVKDWGNIAVLYEQKKVDGNAHVEWLSKVIHKRIVIMEESKRTQTFDSAMLKKLRGGGVVAARPPYGKDSVEQTPTWMLFLLNNHPIKLSDQESFAVRTSMAAFEFPSTFIDANDPTFAHLVGKPLVFDQIDNLQDKFKQRPYKIALFNILCEYGLKYMNEGLVTTPSQYDRTNLYTDPPASETKEAQHYFDLAFEITGDHKDRYTPTEILTAMKEKGYATSATVETLGRWLVKTYGAKDQPIVDGVVRKKSGVDKYFGIRPRSAASPAEPTARSLVSADYNDDDENDDEEDGNGESD